MTAKERDILQSNLSKQGIETEISVAIEEAAELTKELTKKLRGMSSDKKICEEIADLQIVLDQLTMYFDPDDEKIRLFRQFKIKRLDMFYVKGDHQ
jgi:NTP pyrophosphatase (non-canonical NTP hydrolase)